MSLYNSRDHGIRKDLPVALLSAALFSGITAPAQAGDMQPASFNPDISYEVLKAAPKDAAKPNIGDLVEIRFRGSYKGNVFDDTFSTSEPYIYRAGVGIIVKGLDDTVVNMHVGDKYHVAFGGELGFGQKGRPAAPGKPRIPPNAVLDYDVELEALPGTGDDMIADFDAE